MVIIDVSLSVIEVMLNVSKHGVKEFSCNVFSDACVHVLTCMLCRRFEQMLFCMLHK